MATLIKFFSNLKFASPKANKIAIVYVDDEWIKRLILRDLPSTTLAPYSQDHTIYATPGLIARMLWRLRLIDWIKSWRLGGPKELFRQIYIQYFLACLDQIKAQVVLTIVDNSSFFHKLSRADDKRTYFAIQNGTRTLACVRDALPKPPDPSATISMTNFFCFGQRDVDLFIRHGHKIANYLPVGSLIAGYYKSMVSAEPKEQKFDLCLISQWHEHFFKEIIGNDFSADVSRRVGTGINGVNLFVRRLLEETNLSLVVCPRNDHDETETMFYKNAFGEKAKIAESDRKIFSTYRVIEQSRLVIALNSTTLADVFPWGKKVLWCNTTDDEHYEMPEAGISYFCGDDYNAFKGRVLELLKMPQDNYEQLTGERARYINSYDPNNPPHEIIRAAVIKALSNPNKATKKLNQNVQQ